MFEDLNILELDQLLIDLQNSLLFLPEILLQSALVQLIMLRDIPVELINGSLRHNSQECMDLLALRLLLLEILLIQLIKLRQGQLVSLNPFVLVYLLPSCVDAWDGSVVHHVDVGFDH